MSTRNSPYDVVIAGARCAGAATAMLLARQGARVLLLDRSRYGADTLSTHALMRGGVLQLHRWGLLPHVIAAGTPAVRLTTFHLPGAVSTVEIKPKHGVDGLYAPRRTVLDVILVDAARRAGADVRFGTSVTGLRRDRTGRVTGITGRAGAARLEVGADLVVGARRPALGRRAVRRRDGRPRRTRVERPHLPVLPFRDAEILARVVASRGPDAVGRYQAERDELSLRLFRVTGRIAAFNWTADDIGGHLLEMKDAMADEMAAMTHGHWGVGPPALTPVDVSLVFKEQHQLHIHAGRSLAQRGLIALVLVLATAVWFSASAVVPALATIVTIQLIPLLAGVTGWRYAFVALAAGPATALPAMTTLNRRTRRDPPTVPITATERASP
jgi:hypothetical protein